MHSPYPPTSIELCILDGERRLRNNLNGLASTRLPSARISASSVAAIARFHLKFHMIKR